MKERGRKGEREGRREGRREGGRERWNSPICHCIYTAYKVY